MESLIRFFNIPKSSFFLFGPRGTGKSTWLRKHFSENTLFLDLLKPEMFRLLSAKPERLSEMILGDKKIKTVIIDEIQKIPELLDQVHSLIEEHKKIQFVMTGSSARKLKRTGVNLLAGRALVKTFHPFMAAELENRFDIEKALSQGLIPLVVDATVPDHTLQSYAALYLREEVQTEGLVRNIGSFSRFLEALSFSHGSVLNLSHVARECQVGSKTAEGFLEVLEDLLLASRLPCFQKRAKRAVINHPKFYYFDCGVFRSLRPTGPLDEPEIVSGAALEGLVYQHLQAWIAYSENKCSLSYWRTRAGNEVDFIVYGPNEFYAIEVKNSARIRSEDYSGLKAFGEDYPKASRVILYRGKHRYEHDGILCLPCETFLKNLKPGTPLS